MAGVGGPKNPSPPGGPGGAAPRVPTVPQGRPADDAPSAAGAPAEGARGPDGRGDAAGAAQTAAPRPEAEAPGSQPSPDFFVPRTTSPDLTGAHERPRLVPLEGGASTRGTGVAARLQALGVRETPKQKQGPAWRVVDTPQGRVAEGRVRIESAADLEKLRGVVAIRGDFTLAETGSKGVPLDALSSLVEITGRFTLEGNAGIRSLDALARLERVGSTVYLGFNDALSRVALPKLAFVGGAFIVEANAQLEELALPALRTVERYLHIHENAKLHRVEAKALAEVKGELSILQNRCLFVVAVGAPLALGGQLEVAKNAAERMQGISLA